MHIAGWGKLETACSQQSDLPHSGLTSPQLIDLPAFVLPAGKYGKIWRHRRERELWRNDVTSSLTAARLAYCAMTAQDLFAPVIDHLNPDVEVKRPKTKKKKR